MSTYAWVELGAVIIPLLFTFHPRLRFHRNWSAAFIGIAGMMGLFLPWDIVFARAGVWGFTAEHVWHARLAGLPLEEWAFFPCVAYACLFSYHCFGVLGMKDRLAPHTRGISAVIAIMLAVVAAIAAHRAYTFSALSLCAIWVAFTAFVQRAPWLGRFYQTYGIMLLPFLVVNGLLTGTGFEQPVVWYDDAENLGLRVLTIPVEDIFYGMLMIGLSTSLYEAISARKDARTR